MVQRERGWLFLLLLLGCSRGEVKRADEWVAYHTVPVGLPDYPEDIFWVTGRSSDGHIVTMVDWAILAPLDTAVQERVMGDSEVALWTARDPNVEDIMCFGYNHARTHYADSGTFEFDFPDPDTLHMVVEDLRFSWLSRPLDLDVTMPTELYVCPDTYGTPTRG